MYSEDWMSHSAVILSNTKTQLNWWSLWVQQISREIKDTWLPCFCNPRANIYYARGSRANKLSACMHVRVLAYAHTHTPGPRQRGQTHKGQSSEHMCRASKIQTNRHVGCHRSSPEGKRRNCACEPGQHTRAGALDNVYQSPACPAALRCPHRPAVILLQQLRCPIRLGCAHGSKG